MPLSALGLLLLSTITHAAWNSWVKGSTAKLAYLWWAQVAGIILFAVPIAMRYPLDVPREVWPILLASGLCETGYMVSLTRAYRVGDLSLVYPLARGSAPLFITLWAALFLMERLPLTGYAAIGLLTLGIYLVSLRGWSEFWRPLRALAVAETRWALLAGVFIAGYSTFDKIGVGYMAPPAYSLWVFTSMTVICLPATLALEGRVEMGRTLRRQWRRIILGGLFVVATYFLVLWALAQAPASYVGAVRGVSVLLGTAWGVRMLGESFGTARALGAVLMFGGIAVLALAG